MKWISFFSKTSSIGYTYLIFGLLIINPLIEVFNLQLGVPISYSILDASIFITLLSVVLLFSRKLKATGFESSYAKIIVPLYLAYQLSIILRVFLNGEGMSIKYFVTNQYILWPMVIPFLYFFDKTPDALVYLTKTLFLMGMLFLVIAALDFPLLTSRLTGEPLMGCLALPIGFILFNMTYFSRRNQWLALLVLLVALSNSIFLARRSLILTFGLLLLIAIILILRNTKISAWIKALPAGALAICLLIIFSDSFIPKMTERINERLTEDSRSYVVDNFFKDMEKDMLFGKGMNGKYYSPIEETAYVEDGVKFDEIEFRDMIENGYLQSVLSGGIVNVVLFLLTILPAAFLGIVKSNNSFTRACGLTILLFAVDMVAYGLPRLTTQYLVVWISVGVCYTHSLRNLDEEYWHIKFNPTS